MSSRERGNPLLTRLDRWLGIPLTVPASLYRRLSRKPENFSKRKKTGIFCPGAVGDLLLLSALTDGIKKCSPESQIELIGTEANAQALCLNPHADTIFYAPLKKLATILTHIRRQHFDILIDASQWARIGNLVCNLSGAKVTAGFETAGQYRSCGYDLVCRHRSDCHEITNFLRLGQKIWPRLSGLPSVKYSPPAVPVPPEGIIYLHMWPACGRGRALKEWPAENWARLGRNLLAAGFKIGLTGSREDAAANLAFIRQYFADGEPVASLAGRVDWQELAALFRGASAVVSVNTGTMHLAAIAGAPTVGLHGATNPLRWGPVGPKVASLLPRSGQSAYLNLGFEYPAGVRPAMQNLPVEDVMAALARLGVI